MKRQYKGKEFAKVLTYYGLIDGVSTLSFNICCPFHDDKSPSMLINLEEGSFYCFVCDISGNVLDFVNMVNPELNEVECCILIEKILKSDEVKGVSIKNRKRRKKYSRQNIIEAQDYYFGLSQNDWYNPRQSEEYEILEYMHKRGFRERDLQFADCKLSYDIAYPILFPIYDNGEFRGWVARTMNSRVEKIRKYLYNDGFRKRETLCGSYKRGCIPLVCEGFMDYLSLSSRGGIENVVALLGWHLSDGQCAKLKEKGIETVVSALDNDEPGQKGTRYLERFFNVIQFPYPEGVKDAGDMTRKQIRIAIRKVERENGINL